MVDALMRDFAVGGAVVGNRSAVYFFTYAVTQVPAGLVIFRVKEDGTLALARAYHTDATVERPMFWTGMVVRSG